MAINQQPGKMMIGTVDGHRDWDTGLLDCCSDCKACRENYSFKIYANEAKIINILKYTRIKSSLRGIVFISTKHDLIFSMYYL